MTDSGYVYVLINPSIENLVKIGKTTRDPEERAKELSSATGVPTPFIVVYNSYFKNCTKAETFVHAYLENKGFRVSSKREFFEIPIKDAIDAVIKAKDHFGEFDNDNISQSLDENNYYSNPWDELLEKAESYRYGINDIQDDNDAIKYYLKAIKLGYTQGYRDIADIYRDAENPKKSFEFYKKGANNGISECYADIASYYIYEEKDFEKALQSYELYMKHTDKENLYYFDIVQYFKLTIYAIEVTKNRTDIEYFEKTVAYKDKILEYLKSNISMPILELYKDYSSCTELPYSLQDGLLREYDKINSDNYFTASYSGIFTLEYGFIKYLENVYAKGYSSPNNFDFEMLSIEITEL